MASNREYVQAMNELRRSNASGKHDVRENRQRTRKDARKAAINDSRED